MTDPKLCPDCPFKKYMTIFLANPTQQRPTKRLPFEPAKNYEQQQKVLVKNANITKEKLLTPPLFFGVFLRNA